MSRLSLILDKLIAARLGQTWEYAVPSTKERLPTGWLPIQSFQSEDCGGSAARTRLSELRSPEGSLASRAARGIPIELRIFEYLLNGETLRIFAYRLALDPDQLIFLDRNHCRMNKQLLADRGYELIETTADPGGGKSVRLRKRPDSPPGQQARLAI